MRNLSGGLSEGLRLALRPVGFQNGGHLVESLLLNGSIVVGICSQNAARTISISSIVVVRQ